MGVASTSPTRTATESIVSGTGSGAVGSARALGEDEACEVRSGLGRNGNVLRARQPADLDQRPGQELCELRAGSARAHEGRPDRGRHRHPPALQRRPGRERRCRSRPRPPGRAARGRPARADVPGRSRTSRGRVRSARRIAAPSAIARSSSSASCASTRTSRPRSCAAARKEADSPSSRSRRSRSAASAPASLAWTSSLRSRKKPLARSGTPLRRARCPQVVPGASEALVDEDRDCRRAGHSRTRGRASRGSASGRRSPAEGERRLISAIAPRPGAASASRNRPIRRPPRPGRRRRARRVAPPRRRSRVPPKRFRSPPRDPRRDHRRRSRLRRSGAPPRASGPRSPRKISRTVVAFSAGVPPVRSSGRQRGTPKSAGSICRLHDVAAHDFADEVRASGRELVDAAGSVDDEGAAGSELCEHLRDRRHELGGVDADHLRPRAGRVRERSRGH